MMDQFGDRLYDLVWSRLFAFIDMIAQFVSTNYDARIMNNSSTSIPYSKMDDIDGNDISDLLGLV